MRGSELVVKITGNILHVYEGQLEVACHTIVEGNEIGPDVSDFMQKDRQSRPIHWYD